MLEVFLRCKTTSGHECIGDADRCSAAKLHSDIEIIILLKERIFNDVKNVALVVVPVFVGKLCSNHLNAVCKVVALNVIALLQHGTYSVGVLRLERPKVHIAGFFGQSACVCNIEHIFKPWLVAGVVDEGNTL
ncbi:MAG: hypothetical protein PHY23_00695 [Oscillospiraceae bacterium]|nr:hypothetical protein [Oscillospiraceae bacterium]